MSVAVEVVEARACPTAVVEVRTTQADLPATIGRSLDLVWAFLRSSDLVTNHNVVVYRGDLAAEGGGLVEVGVQVDRPFDDAGAPDGVRCRELPAATVARAVHVGPYHRMGETHDAIRAWCAEHGHELDGLSWEVYGDWDDDVTKLETDCAWVLRPAGG